MSDQDAITSQALTEPVEEGEVVAKQMRFDGMPVRDHDIAFTGLVAMGQETVAAMKVGKTVKFTGIGRVVARTHRFKSEKDTGEKWVHHQVTIQIDYVEPEE